jgi:hypothetical protein
MIETPYQPGPRTRRTHSRAYNNAAPAGDLARHETPHVNRWDFAACTTLLRHALYRPAQTSVPGGQWDGGVAPDALAAGHYYRIAMDLQVGIVARCVGNLSGI